jgi:hypothetical protein
MEKAGDTELFIKPHPKSRRKRLEEAEKGESTPSFRGNIS